MCEITPKFPQLPFGEATRELIAAGDNEALLRGLACLAGCWIQAAGGDVAKKSEITATNGVVHESPALGALLLAGLDLLAVIELSPQGREAIANFRSKPLLQQAKGE